MFGRSDFAKYPFLPSAGQYVSSLNIGLEDLSAEDFKRVDEHAKARILDAIVGCERRERPANDDIEILSFPRAVILLNYIHEERANRRFALFEAERSYRFLCSESDEKLIGLSKEMFNWDMVPVISGSERLFSLHVSDYLKCAASIREARWRLVNRRLERGYVILTKREASILLRQRIMHRILSRLSSFAPPAPAKEREAIYRIKSLILEKLPKEVFGTVPREVVPEAMPPCIQWLHQSISSGRNLSHIERFTFTAFLLNIGASPDDVLEYFKTSTDFDIGKSRYQVEHIRGLKGVRRAYLPPKCNTLRTHGVCHNPDMLCKQIAHPLQYYKRRVKRRFEEHR
ncbi:MAG: DNA primase large subunit PriL [Candidatus Bathyarchaeia archaeon]